MPPPLYKKPRESGIELLKIFALLFIVISHIAQTVTTSHEFIWYPEYVFNIETASFNLNAIGVLLCRHLGSLGNHIFFIASFWFLCENPKGVKTEKIACFVIDVWVISVLMLIGISVFCGPVPAKLLIKSIFPTLFSNNWFITCYIIIFALHPVLNRVISSLEHRDLLLFCIIVVSMYFVFGMISSGFFFSSPIIVFVSLYFVVAYVKKYRIEWANNVKLNALLFASSLILFLILIFATEFMGMHVSFLRNKMLHWNSNQNLLILLIAFAMFNVVRAIKFSSKFINYIASVSLIVYVTHENILFRQLIRPYIFTKIYENYGYDDIIAWIMILAIILFVMSVIVSIVYKTIIQRFTFVTARSIDSGMRRLVSRILDAMTSAKSSV